MNRTDRMMAVVLLLRSRHKLTARQLAEVFEVSVRTIYRDIDALCQAGVPIAVELGPEGGYSLLESYSLPPVMFSLDEAVALFLGGSLIARGARMPFEGALRTALIKIEDILPEELRASARATSEAILFDLAARPAQPLAAGVFEALNRAILGRKCVRIVYRKAGEGETTERVVAPFGLIFDGQNGAWYLVGFCHLRGRQRMFHLGRIESIAPTGRSYEVPPEFDLRSLGHRAWGRSFAEALKRERPRIRIRVRKEISERLRRQWLLRYAEREETPDGKVILSFHDRLPAGLSLLSQFGADCEVLEPAELRQQVVEQARKVLALYGGQDEATDRSHEPA